MKENLKKIFQGISSGKFTQAEALEKIKLLKAQEQGKTAGIQLVAPTWEPAAAAPGSPTVFAQRHVFLCEMPAVNKTQLSALLPGSEIIHLPVSQQNMAARYEQYALLCFEHIRHILSNKPQEKILVQVVTGDSAEQQVFTGLSGLLKTATLENPLLAGQIIITSSQGSTDALARQLDECGRQTGDLVIRYEQDTRYVLRRKEIYAAEINPKVVFKDQGVYLITGGTGGIGMLFAREILKQTARSRIILTGRAALTPERKAMLDALPMRNNKVEYRQLDLCDREAVNQLIAGINANQQLNGILHCAGMTADNFIIKKSGEEFSRVLSPKVTGTFHLDEASKDTDLDFLVLFSSVAAVMGNVGQCDYAAANGFMDQFAVYRQQLTLGGLRYGQTLSVNWPLWQEGGMQVEEANKEILRQTMDVQPLSTIAGMYAFYSSMAWQQQQVLVIPEPIIRTDDKPMPAPAEANVVTAINTDNIFEKTEAWLCTELSSLLKMTAHQIDPQAALEKYGIDSILAMSLTSRLEKTFGSLPKTLFFEYTSIRELTGYFVKSHQAQLAVLFHQPATPAKKQPTDNQPPQQPMSGKRFSRPGTQAASKSILHPFHNEPIAIIGLSGRYPQSANIDTYWRNLRDGKDCITEVPSSRWDWQAYYSEDRTQEGRHYSKWGGFIEGVDEFDPRFFNIAPREAAAIDPQERLFLQHAWMAVEDAGYTRSTLQIPHEDELAGQVGVYAGVMYGEYNLSGSLASIANRVSYFLNLHGPSMTLDTMCSSSLTAIHLACEDLKQGRTDLGIAGGVNVSIHPNKYLMLSAGQFISGDGHCQSFGEGGDGYIPGEGVGVVVLKRLSEAERDGNHIYGIIRGSSLNHGGKTNGYSVPNPNAQAAAIKRALKASGTDPRHISYIEAHGTGTKLGDPIEIAALGKAFGSEEKGFCLIGSAKSNIGHCESAAGIAGLTKILLQLKYRQIVPSLHSKRLNPHIDFEQTPFVVNQTLRSWEQPVVNGKTVPRIAGVSSFGAGGSNAHIILQEYVASGRVVSQPAAVIVPLSARTAAQLQQKVQELLQFIRTSAQDNRPLELASMAYTLQVGREAMEERMGVVVSSPDELTTKLQAYLNSETVSALYRGQVKREPDFTDTSLDYQQLSPLLEAWVQGHTIDWRRLYDNVTPALMSLPVYPFAKERYWTTVTKEDRIAVSVLHPLLHRNISNLQEQGYSATFTGDEFFISGYAFRKELPAAVFPEMARAAVCQALPEAATQQLEIHRMSWGEPLLLNEAREVNIALLAKNTTTVDFEIYNPGGDTDTICCQGHVTITAKSSSPKLDITQLKKRLTGAQLHTDEVYAALGYGPAYQAIVAVHQGEQELLAHLKLPAVADHTGFMLHPVVVESALQAGIVLVTGLSRPLRFDTVDTVRIFRDCQQEMFAWVRPEANGVDIDLCDVQGNVCVQLLGVHFGERVPKVMIQSVVQHVYVAPPAPKEIRIPGNVTAAMLPFQQVILKKPGNISLVTPAVLAVNRVVAEKGTVRLSATGIDTPAAAVVSLFDHGNGVYAIKLADSYLSGELITQLRQALVLAEQQASLKVLLLEGNDTVFLRGGRAAYNEAVTQQLYRTIAAFPCPVMAVMTGDATGAGFLVAALCDFMIGSQEGSYHYADPEGGLFPTMAEETLLKERFGNEFDGSTGPVMRVAEVMPYAQQLASDLASKPAEALRLLKQHLGRDIVALTEKLTPVALWETAAAPAEHTANIVSNSKLLKLDSDAAGILTIHLLTPRKKYTLKDIVAALEEVVTQVNRGSIYKAIILRSDDAEFIAVPDVAADAASILALTDLLLTAAVPVIAALEANAGAAGWLVSQFCDACVYNETGVYTLSGLLQVPVLAQRAALIFSYTLGRYTGQEIMLTGGTYTGVALRQSTGTVTVAGKAAVLAKALALATSRSSWPLTAARNRKQERTAFLSEKMLQLPSWPQVQEEPTMPLPQAIVLKSEVVRAIVHPAGIVEVRMEDREAKNMFSEAFIEGIREVFAHIAANPVYKVIILTGYDNYFASGGTKESLLAIQEGKAKFTDTRIFQLALDCSVPVIAAMQGHGIGAGWSMGMFADIILFSEESHYVSPYMRYGFTPGAGATFIFPYKTGYDLARETLFTAREYTGSELRSKGLSLPVSPRKEVLAAAFTLAEQIAQHPRSSLVALKQQLTSGLAARLEEACRLELAMHEQTFVGHADTLQQIEHHFYNAEGHTPEPPPAVSAVPQQDTALLPDIISGLRTLLAQELQLQEDEVDEHTQFVDLGLDSITGVTFIRKINEKYQTSIQATVVYTYSTIAQLSGHVKEEAEKAGTLVSKPVAPVAEPTATKQTPSPKITPDTTATKKLTSWRHKAVLRTAATTQPAYSEQAIAVVGMAGQFPGAKDIAAFWENIAQGKNSIVEVPAKRWNIAQYYQEGEAAAGKTYSKWMGALEAYDLFDPLFFNISPTEAESMDPQQRLFLQTCWHAVEHAGYNPQQLSGSKCGVFVGCAAGDYLQQSQEHQLSAYGFTGAATSILAARISYFLNLQGPCISVDTACSSSLVAISHACDSLLNGSSNLALAGGVYVMATPSMHIMSAQSGMLSPDGRCFTFDQRANGFVPGEGVGVIMLKRLEDAERDHDHIYGIIRGWGVNQDGKTNGITAPNTLSQAMLEQQVYDRFQINPAEIQLIEAHGTGTKLGDPIEVEGLKKSFEKYTKEKSYCAIGSVKSNIGHCLTAAGVAGFIKLLQAIQHKQLPPTINFEKLNEHIRLEGSPFYVNTQLADWKIKETQQRQAAISSFGFSGTNAHLVLGEYLPAGRSTDIIVPSAPQIIVLSARSAEQLKQQAANLLTHLENGSFNITDIAYTLQTGREAMEERLGFMAGSVAELTSKLQSYLDGNTDGICQGQVKRNKEGLRIISNDGDIKDAIIDNLISHGKLLQLLDLWVKGLDLDWQRFYPGAKPRRVGLPVYPFAKERYWIETAAKNKAIANTTAVLHPLLHSNTSNLHQQCYTTTFTGTEDFMQGHPIIPATVYLEMARAAAVLANPPQDAAAAIELRDLVWTQSSATAGHQDIITALYATADDQTAIEIYSRTEEEERMLFQGQAVYSDPPEAARQDIRQLIAQMQPLAMAPHAVIKAVYRNDSQLLAELQLPLSGAQQDACLLNPVITEGMLQAAVLAVSHHFNASLTPVAATVVRITGACAAAMAAWIHHISGNTLDIDLLDEQGKVCVQVKGLTLQEAAAHQPIRKTQEEEAPLLQFFREQWEEQAMPVVTPPQENSTIIIFAGSDLREKIVNDPAAGPLATATFVYQGNKYKAVADNICQARFNHMGDMQQVLGAVTGPLTLIYTWAKDQQETGIDAIFNVLRVVKEIPYPVHLTLAGHYDPAIPDTCWDYSWIGFERSLKMLLPNVRISPLYTDDAVFTPQQLLAAMQYPGISWYKGSQRLIPAITVASDQTAQPSVLKKNGCYLITGGGGKLGFSFAQYLAETYQAKLILLGRTPLTPGMEEKLAQLKQAGAIAADYASVDISDREAMTAWAKQLSVELSGIIHAAGVEGSAAFYEKTTEDINAVLRPKTTGTILLDELLQHHPLDFVCYFASSAALLGDFGSCDYAVANRFQMAYAQYRQQHSGKTCVINWPFWQEGGMGKGDAAQAAFYLKSSGQAVLGTSEGIQVWEKLIRLDNTQTLVLKGKPSRMEQFLHRLYAVEQQRESPVTMPSAHTGKGWKPQYQDLPVKECIYKDLIRLVAGSQKISPEKLDGVTNLADYGFDSISLTTFAKQLTAYFAVAVTPALFFNYATIEALSSHLAQEHATHMSAFYSSPQQTMQQPENTAAVPPGRSTPSPRKQRLQRVSGVRVAEEPIAIIGMSGRFPKADTIDQLWSLLEKGESGISEIPLSRWNWADYFTTPGDPGNKISTNKGGFINHVDEFDPLFFEITPREAAATDPGQRLLLMEAYRAIEDAQIDPSSLRGTSTGVFVGMEESQYDALAADEQGVGNSGNAMISSRLSYYLDLHGPAIATNTACSSGLVALHQAVMSLRNGECDAALVAGVSSFILSPVFYAKMSQAGMLSKDGQCFSFSKNANGIGAGEAVVVLMLKPLSAAIADGNRIYGVVKASGINFDGKTNGVTAPNGKSQETLIRNIYTRYNIDPQNISHIVAHGTGTKLGDPVELNALQEAFKKLSNGAATPAPYCAVTSCKSNLGHTMAASGLVSVVSLLKGLHHHKIPASIHCEEENDYISRENSPFYINKTTKDWETAAGKLRMGGVSAFGRSGTNAHVVIEEYIAPVTPVVSPDNTRQVMIVLSAKTSEQLLQKAADLLDFIHHPDQSFDLTAMAYSLQVTREEMDVRLGFIVSSIEELATGLRAYLHGEKEVAGCYRGEVKHYDNAVSIFNADADLQETVDKWIANRKLTKLLELWVKGLQLDWHKLYGEVKPARISLPKYPFAREKYWFTQSASRPAIASAPVNADKHVGAIADLISQIENDAIETDEAVTLLKHIAYTK